MSCSRSAALTMVLTGLVFLWPSFGWGAECDGATYKGPAFDQETAEFSPFDAIYVILNCTGLRPGEHTMHANWLHNERGLIRSDSHTFTSEDGTKRGLYFWFKLSKKGPIASMLSNEDFHEENFGEWTVKIFLDDTEVAERSFRIAD